MRLSILESSLQLIGGRMPDFAKGMHVALELSRGTNLSNPILKQWQAEHITEHGRIIFVVRSPSRFQETRLGRGSVLWWCIVEDEKMRDNGSGPRRIYVSLKEQARKGVTRFSVRT